jgi:hypothetical protein
MLKYKTSTTIIVKFAVDGIHNFPAAEELYPEVGFLQYPHRHMFHFTAAIKVTHSDRDKEFICVKRDMINYLTNRYFDTCQRTLIFDSKSCEMLAEEILNQFDCEWVEVWEDNENGARVDKI